MLTKTNIQLAYQKRIDRDNTATWDKNLLESVWEEYHLQIQTIDPEKRFIRFSQICYEPTKANQLNHLVSAAVIPYLKQCDGLIPDIRTSLGKQWLRFQGFQFQLIEAVRDKPDSLAYSITFISTPLVLHAVMHDRLLLSDSALYTDEKLIHTEMISLEKHLSVFAILPDDKR